MARTKYKSAEVRLAYHRERNRLLSARRRAEKVGTVVERFEIPAIPKVVTAGSVRRLQRIPTSAVAEGTIVEQYRVSSAGGTRNVSARYLSTVNRTEATRSTNYWKKTISSELSNLGYGDLDIKDALTEFKTAKKKYGASGGYSYIKGRYIDTQQYMERAEDLIDDDEDYSDYTDEELESFIYAGEEKREYIDPETGELVWRYPSQTKGTNYIDYQEYLEDYDPLEDMDGTDDFLDELYAIGSRFNTQSARDEWDRVLDDAFGSMTTEEVRDYFSTVNIDMSEVADIVRIIERYEDAPASSSYIGAFRWLAHIVNKPTMSTTDSARFSDGEENGAGVNSYDGGKFR